MRKFVWLILIFGILGLLVLAPLLNKGYFRGGALSFLTPLLKVSQRVGRTLILPAEKLFSCQHNLKRISRLREENRRLRAKVVCLEGVKSENELLKKQLNIKKNKRPKRVLAQVTGQSSDLKGRVFIVNAGRQDGVKENQTVALPGNILVGKVFSVYESFAKVAPISNKIVSVAVMTQDSEVEGVVRGGGKNQDLIIDLVSFKEKITGEEVVTSGLDGVFVPGLLVGRVKKLKFVPQETSKKGYVKPAADFSQIKKVFIYLDE